MSQLSSKINIAHLIPNLKAGGAENLIKEICRFVDSSKYHVIVAYWGKEDDLAEEIIATGADCVYLNLSGILNLQNIIRVIQFLKNYHVHIIHTHLMDSDLLGVISGFLLKIPVIIHIHSYPYPIEKRHCWRYQVFARMASKIICVSNAVKQYFSEKLKIPLSRLLVIPNGIDIEKFKNPISQEEKISLRNSLGLLPDDHVIGNVSRLIENKGQRDLISAFAKYVQLHPKARLLLIGEGQSRNDFMQHAKTLHIEKNVIFAGFRKNIFALLQIIDVFVFPTYFEAMPLILLEAMAAGKPVIATNLETIKEIINDNDDGILVPTRNSDEIVNALNKIDHDIEFLERLKVHAQMRASTFSIQKTVHTLEQLYSEINHA